MQGQNLPPFPGGLDAANGAQDLRGEVQTGVGEALDFVLGLAAPRVLGVPRDSVAVARVDAGALLGVGVLVEVPEVVKDGEVASFGGAVLLADLGGATDGGGVAHGGQSQGKEGHGGEGLHFGCWDWCPGLMGVAVGIGVETCSEGMETGAPVCFIHAIFSSLGVVCFV